jgi:hypothetical protein
MKQAKIYTKKGKLVQTVEFDGTETIDGVMNLILNGHLVASIPLHKFVVVIEEIVSPEDVQGDISYKERLSKKILIAKIRRLKGVLSVRVACGIGCKDRLHIDIDVCQYKHTSEIYETLENQDVFEYTVRWVK